VSLSFGERRIDILFPIYSHLLAPRLGFARRIAHTSSIVVENRRRMSS
jgi:hypothetical protein